MARSKSAAVDVVRGNELAARIILSNPVKYEGLPLMWAREWMNNGSQHKSREIPRASPR
jgi:hypothetical protein